MRTTWILPALATLCCGSPAEAQTGSSSSLVLPVLGLTIRDAGAPWSVEPWDIAGKPIDYLTVSGSRLSVMIEPTGTSCRDAVDAALRRAGSTARPAERALYAPVPPAENVIEATPGLLAMFCIPLTGRSATFIFNSRDITAEQQEAVRRLALAVARADQNTVRAATPSAPPPTVTIRLPEAGLDVSAPPDHGWTITRERVRGTRIDRLTGTNSDGLRVMVDVSVLTSGSCQSMAQTLQASGAQLVNRPAWIPDGWSSPVVNFAGGLMPCLPLRGRYLWITLSSVRTEDDTRRIQSVLAGLRVAAYERWGAP